MCTGPDANPLRDGNPAWSKMTLSSSWMAASTIGDHRTGFKVGAMVQLGTDPWALEVSMHSSDELL